MRILFGPEHDGLHIDPSEPNGYEWWYFDAISDDERYVLVVIFFLGTPMSPYYKAVVDGKNPLPKDWCGVFVTLHERVGDSYKERSYAYNVYSDTANDFFSAAPSQIKVNNSEIHYSRHVIEGIVLHDWHIVLNEKNLWLGDLKGELSFQTRFTLDQTPVHDKHEAHTWVCVAPNCRVNGWIKGCKGGFSGSGYHDHNLGTLPWLNTKRWYWGRARVPCNDDSIRHIVYYINEEMDGTISDFCMVTSGDMIEYYPIARDFAITKFCYPNQYGLQFPVRCHFGGAPFDAALLIFYWFNMSVSPFYQRSISSFRMFEDLGGYPYVDNRLTHRTNVTKSALLWYGEHIGISEAFEPARLCGPIISRMMWTRIRRRS